MTFTILLGVKFSVNEENHYDTSSFPSIFRDIGSSI